MKKLSLFTFLVLMFCNTSFADSLKVVDGDTIVLNGEKIRFSGIDAPELKQMCIDKEDRLWGTKIVIKTSFSSCGKTAKMILARKIGSQKIECIKEGKDIYKRTLAECFVNGESLSIFLVRSGYAFAYRKYSDKFIKDEEFAKENKLGMWTMKFQYPWDFRKS